ncbi:MULTISPECIES: ABC transporter permease/substrate-binding protein [unclassified Bacillus (in: firmicutes)]|uniref:ABC transporter permease/substrate-binding protein n=1 Tax=unclassified Bacillus (in: firmicutes) TaxID=185979 RepID=UPI001BE79685|nr:MULTISPECIES: ABC transporter permease/substrate-binding protein [unclassified Bacillus (in: firmicutes)]MBT2640028.1 osmoprotectant update ABC transporter permease/substrate-binding subunit OpuFB [Bacillus sp. ISL-39]MBT2662833.1 osmoprotectant update ABC transporter permease/substrate-binding subunit OpuFB [Bacillus sp. ISL-45]
MNSWISTFTDRKDELLSALLEHIQISFIALFFAVLIAIPLGIFLTRRKRISEGIIGITAILQTIPSLALLGLLIPLFGIGKVPAIIALVAYALLPILRNTYTGINEVDPSLIEAARGMGMNSKRRLLKVELPLAMPVIMAGIRTAMVLIVGTATIAALIGAGGLGDLILLGIDRNNTALIVLGAIPAALLAILFDLVLRRFETVSFKKSLITIGALSLAVLFIMVIPFLGGKNEEEIVIGGKLGSEPEILINMYKLLIEEETDHSVQLKPGLGKTSFVFAALENGNIDIYPEFTGTAISEFLKETASSTNREEVYQQAREGMKKEFGMEMLQPMDYNNTYALAVPEQLAEENGLKTISDLKVIEPSLRAGFTLEFSDREDGYKGLQKLYGLNLPSLITMEPKLRYRAIKNGEINLVDAYSTDSELQRYNLVVLEDDKNLFPPYQGAPLMRAETAEKYPEIVKALNKLAGKITDDEMRKMNYQVNVEGESAEETAREYLREAGLLK